MNNYWKKKNFEIVFSTEIYENQTFHTLETLKGTCIPEKIKKKSKIKKVTSTKSVGL